MSSTETVFEVLSSLRDLTEIFPATFIHRNRLDCYTNYYMNLAIGDRHFIGCKLAKMLGSRGTETARIALVAFERFEHVVNRL